jgi:hypothetical protein
MEALAEVKAVGTTAIERFLYDLRPNLSRFNTVTLITPSGRTNWIPALTALRRQGVSVSVVLIDPKSFGSASDTVQSLESLFQNDISTYSLSRGQELNEALHQPLGNDNRAGSMAGPSLAQARPRDVAA